jgi:hypothetical protein
MFTRLVRFLVVLQTNMSGHCSTGSSSGHCSYDPMPPKPRPQPTPKPKR